MKLEYIQNLSNVLPGMKTSYYFEMRSFFQTGDIFNSPSGVQFFPFAEPEKTTKTGLEIKNEKLKTEFFIESRENMPNKMYLPKKDLVQSWNNDESCQIVLSLIA